MGRLGWCAHGDVAPWISDAWSTHTSQHLFDPYSFSHIQHGIIFFLILTALRVPPRYRIWAALLLESGWEVLENTPLVIERYRAVTASLEYFGDSVANSAGDLLCALAGYLIAARISPKIAVAILLSIEIAMVLSIRDSLSLNILMLLAPLDAIREWQHAPHLLKG
jgi:hypothetical protein